MHNATHSSPRISVFGGGSWGTAIASICAQQVPTLQWVRRPEVAAEITAHHTNTRYLGQSVRLTTSLRATTTFSEAADHADIAIMAIPSQAFRSVLQQAAQCLAPGIPVISLTKGLEQGTLLRMSQLIEQVLPDHPPAVLSGPNLACEVAEGLWAGAVLACQNLQIGSWVAKWLCNSRFRVYTSEDVIGVEIAGALKNVYAIAAGIGRALRLGENAHAMLIARSLREMINLGQAMGGKSDTFAGLAGVGDLTLTCGSTHSRNHYVGTQLGLGKTLSEVLASMDQAVEGLSTVGTVLHLGRRYRVKVPIATMVNRVINHTHDPRSAYQMLWNQAPAHEVDGSGF